MKYLQIYDHNGNLTKEFPVYLEGADFNWQAPRPEAVWLGTIRIVSEPSEILVTATPEPEFEAEAEPEVEGKADVSLEPELIAEGVEFEIVEEAAVETPAPFIMTGDITEKEPESEVKHEPEKRSYKSRRKPRVKPSNSA